MTFCGIASAGSPCIPSRFPLTRVTCHYTVVDVNVQVVVQQTYTSHMSEAQDISYTFPLPSDAAVCAFTAVVDGRTVRGVVKRKAEAKAEYNAAIAEGKTAALLEEHRAEVFQINLGNLQAGGTVQISISFVSLISNDDSRESLRLTIPLTVAPYYGAPSSQGFALSVSQPDVAVTISFQMESNVMSVASSTHPLSVSLGSLQEDATDDFDPRRAFVRLDSAGLLDRDFVVVVKAAGLDQPRCVLERLPPVAQQESTTDAIALTLVPRFAVSPLERQQYVFLVDRSGSMQGARIAKVRAALQTMLRSLPSRGSHFNIVSFGSHCDSLWQAPSEYNADTFKEASEHVDVMRADFGGTEVKAALEAAFKQRPQSEDPMAVFVLTDGEAWDVQGVIDCVSTTVGASQGQIRVFVLGVGEQVSRAMCDGIARAGQGVASYVGNDEMPDAKLVTLLRAARMPAVRAVSVDWGAGAGASDELADDFELVDAPAAPQGTGDISAPSAPVSLFDDDAATADVGPESLGPQPVSLPPVPRIQELACPPALYAGFRHNLFAIIQQFGGDAARPTEVIVRGVAGDTPVELRIPVMESANSVGFVHSLAARALMKAWEDKNSPQGRAQMARLGVQYGLASAETSFIAVDDGGDVLPVTDTGNIVTERRRGGRTKQTARKSTGGKAPRRQMAAAPAANASAIISTTHNVDNGPPAAKKRKASSEPCEPLDAFDALVRLQGFDGLFAASGLAAVLQLDQLPVQPPGISEEAVWATLLALAWLEVAYADRKDAWIALAERARHALGDAGMREESIQDGMQVASGCLSS